MFESKRKTGMVLSWKMYVGNLSKNFICINVYELTFFDSYLNLFKAKGYLNLGIPKINVCQIHQTLQYLQ